MKARELDDWCSQFRAIDEIRVLHVDLSPGGGREDCALPWLDHDEHQRRDRFVHDGPRRRFTLCRAVLRSVLCHRLDCRNEHLAFKVSEHNKPSATVCGRLAPISFNVSHSGRHGLIALSPAGEVGVDVEERIPHPNIAELIAAVFGPNEQSDLAAVRGQRRRDLFFDLWTMKEALSKAHGMGLSLDVARFEIPPAMREGAVSGCFRFAEMPDITWRLHNISTDEFAAAVAYEDSGR